MSLFTVVSDEVVLSVVPFAEAQALASQEHQRGCRVSVRRARPEELAGSARSWAVEVRAAGKRDVLRCLDYADAQATLHEVQAGGIRAEIVCV